MILALLKSLLSLSSYIAKYVSDKQLIEAGAAKAVADNLNEANKKIHKVNSTGADLSPSGVRNDENNRNE